VLSREPLAQSPDGLRGRQGVSTAIELGGTMQKAPKKKQKCRNCEGKGLVKQGDKKVKCQRCGGTGFSPDRRGE
jgi:DnaJ-class molecular chaperone